MHTDTLRTTLAEVKDPSECCAKLIELAEAGGGHDNITCIVADFQGEQLASPGEGDGFGYMQYPLPLSDDDSSAFVEDDTVGGPHRGEPQEDASSAPTQRPLAVSSVRDEDDLDGDDSRANALWILAGAVALIGALGVWWTLDPKAQGGTAPQEAQPPAAPAPPAPVIEEVQVNVYTDVPGATLLVNGESQGALPAEQSKGLKLKPGAYRFEAQADGQLKAVTVATVRGDTPMDVFLKSPAAAPEEPKPSGATEPKAAEPKERKPEADKPPSTSDEPSEAIAAEAEPAEPAAPRKPRKRPAAESGGASAEPAPAPATPELPSNPF